MIRTLTAAILLATITIASAQNMSQMGNAGTRDCTTQRCIDNVKRCSTADNITAACRNICTTNKDCGR